MLQDIDSGKTWFLRSKSKEVMGMWLQRLVSVILPAPPRPRVSHEQKQSEATRVATAALDPVTFAAGVDDVFLNEQTTNGNALAVAASEDGIEKHDGTLPVIGTETNRIGIDTVPQREKALPLNVFPSNGRTNNAARLSKLTALASDAAALVRGLREAREAVTVIIDSNRNMHLSNLSDVKAGEGEDDAMGNNNASYASVDEEHRGIVSDFQSISFGQPSLLQSPPPPPASPLSPASSYESASQMLGEMGDDAEDDDEVVVSRSSGSVRSCESCRADRDRENATDGSPAQFGAYPALSSTFDAEASLCDTPPKALIFPNPTNIVTDRKTPSQYPTRAMGPRGRRLPNQ